jgi:hypothetical protein
MGLSGTKEYSLLKRGPNLGPNRIAVPVVSISTAQKRENGTEVVYPPCTWLPLFCVFEPFCRLKESITYVSSTPLLVRSPPPLPISHILDSLLKRLTPIRRIIPNEGTPNSVEKCIPSRVLLPSNPRRPDLDVLITTEANHGITISIDSMRMDRSDRGYGICGSSIHPPRTDESAGDGRPASASRGEADTPNVVLQLPLLRNETILV